MPSFTSVWVYVAFRAVVIQPRAISFCFVVWHHIGSVFLDISANSLRTFGYASQNKQRDHTR